MTKWFWHCLHVKKGSSGSFGTLVLYAKSKVPRRVPKKSLIYHNVINLKAEDIYS